MRRMQRAAAAVTAMAMLAAACGDDDGGGGQAQTEEGAIEAVESGVGGALTGNAGQVLNFMNAECRESVDTDDVQLALGLAQTAGGPIGALRAGPMRLGRRRSRSWWWWTAQRPHSHSHSQP